MTADDFRRIALSLKGAEESSHMGAADFRVGGHIFATLATIAQGYGNLALSPEQQAAFVEEAPELFLPVAGGWGRMGMTHIHLAVATEDVLRGALQAAWKRRVEKNKKAPAMTTKAKFSGKAGESRVSTETLARGGKSTGLIGKGRSRSRSKA